MAAHFGEVYAGQAGRARRLRRARAVARGEGAQARGGMHLPELLAELLEIPA